MTLVNVLLCPLDWRSLALTVISHSKSWFMPVHVIKEISSKKSRSGGLINFSLDRSIEALHLVVVFLGISKLRNFELSITTVIFGKKCLYDA